MVQIGYMSADWLYDKVLVSCQQFSYLVTCCNMDTAEVLGYRSVQWLHISYMITS